MKKFSILLILFPLMSLASEMDVARFAQRTLEEFKKGQDRVFLDRLSGPLHLFYKKNRSELESLKKTLNSFHHLESNEQPFRFPVTLQEGTRYERRFFKITLDGVSSDGAKQQIKLRVLKMPHIALLWGSTYQIENIDDAISLADPQVPNNAPIDRTRQDRREAFFQMSHQKTANCLGDSDLSLETYKHVRNNLVVVRVLKETVPASSWNAMGSCTLKDSSYHCKIIEGNGSPYGRVTFDYKNGTPSFAAALERKDQSGSDLIDLFRCEMEN